MNPIRTGLTRRGLLGGLTALLAGTALTRRPAVAAEDEAARLIDGMARETIALVSDRDMDRGARSQRLLDLLDAGFDGETIARFVLGSHWRTASPNERREFKEAFRTFTALTYARRFEAYSGEQLRILGTRDQSGDDGRPRMLVQSELTRADGAPVKVDWRVREAEDGWRVYDVVVEGVSMLLTQRSEFASVIQQQGGMTGLVRQLRNRSAQLEQEAGRTG